MPSTKTSHLYAAMKAFCHKRAGPLTNAKYGALFDWKMDCIPCFLSFHSFWLFRCFEAAVGIQWVCLKDVDYPYMEMQKYCEMLTK